MTPLPPLPTALPEQLAIIEAFTAFIVAEGIRPPACDWEWEIVKKSEHLANIAIAAAATGDLTLARSTREAAFALAQAVKLVS